MMFSRLFLSTLPVFLASVVLGFDVSRNDNVAVYYGQNSYGASNPGNPGGWQKSLSTYCQDDAIDVFPLAFLHVFFSTGGLPEINMANICNSADNGVFPGTNLARCQHLAADIKACQARGKIVTLSLGGATAGAGFTSDAQAQTFADTVWNLFLGGASSTRPFGDAVLDGVDLDIEGGSSTGYTAFVNRLRSRFNGASKRYYVTAAPQCPYPDGYLGAVLNSAHFDAVFVQVLYNNWCGLHNFNNPNAWNFAQWDTWAKTISPNRNVKIYIGAPAATGAAGSGYVDSATLSNIARTTRSQYSSFGGVMLWDASQAYANNRYDAAIKGALRGGPITTAPPPSSTPGTSTPPSGSCGGVAAWSSGSVYVGGNRVVYNGHLWTAKWWTQGDIPGGPAGVWTDNGPCGSRVATAAVDDLPAPAFANPTAAPELPAAEDDISVDGEPEASNAIAEATPDAQPVKRFSRFFQL